MNDSVLYISFFFSILILPINPWRGGGANPFPSLSAPKVVYSEQDHLLFSKCVVCDFACITALGVQFIAD
jgi:hypothetical protein